MNKRSYFTRTDQARRLPELFALRASMDANLARLDNGNAPASTVDEATHAMEAVGVACMVAADIVDPSDAAEDYKTYSLWAAEDDVSGDVDPASVVKARGWLAGWHAAVAVWPGLDLTGALA